MCDLLIKNYSKFAILVFLAVYYVRVPLRTQHCSKPGLKGAGCTPHATDKPEPVHTKRTCVNVNRKVRNARQRTHQTKPGPNLPGLPLDCLVSVTGRRWGGGYETVYGWLATSGRRGRDCLGPWGEGGTARRQTARRAPGGARHTTAQPGEGEGVGPPAATNRAQGGEG